MHLHSCYEHWSEFFTLIWIRWIPVSSMEWILSCLLSYFYTRLYRISVNSFPMNGWTLGEFGLNGSWWQILFLTTVFSNDLFHVEWFMVVCFWRKWFISSKWSKLIYSCLQYFVIFLLRAVGSVVIYSLVPDVGNLCQPFVCLKANTLLSFQRTNFFSLIFFIWNVSLNFVNFCLTLLLFLCLLRVYWSS